MKTAKRITAALLTLLMIFSAAVVATAEGEENHQTVNVKITEPVAGEKASFTLRVDGGRYSPGTESFLDYDMFCYGYEYLYRNNLDSYLEAADIQTKIEIDQYTAALDAETDSEKRNMMQAQLTLMKDRSESIRNMIQCGVGWFEYSQEAIDKLKEMGLKEIPDNSNELMSYISNYCPEYARYLKPGDKFESGKYYICCVEVGHDYSDFIKELKPYCKALDPYYEKYMALEKELSDASYEEQDEIYAKIDRLGEEYKTQFSAFEAKRSEQLKKIEKEGFDNYPLVTVNGNKTDVNMKGIWYSAYSFGNPAENGFLTFFNNIIQTITEFFQKIFDFFSTWKITVNNI